MKAKGNSGEFKQPDTGTVNAVCTRVVDLGTQETIWEGKPKKAHKVMVAWEVDQLMDDGRPFMVTQRYTLSIHPKSIMGAHLTGWRGVAFTDQEVEEGFDPGRLLGKPCLLTLVKNGDYVNIAGIAKLPKGMTPLEPVGPLTLFDLENYSEEVYCALSEKVRETIAKSPEFQKATGETPPGQHGDAPEPEIPF